MQLTLYTDYSLRVLLYLGIHAEQRVTVTEISEFFGISRNHLVKVVHNLGKQGLVETMRGKSGGLRLAKAPEDINIGEIVQKVEPHMNLLECFDDATNTCPVTMQCALKGVLYKARKSFTDELAQYSLRDIMNMSALRNAPVEISIASIGRAETSLTRT